MSLSAAIAAETVGLVLLDISSSLKYYNVKSIKKLPAQYAKKSFSCNHFVS